MDRATRSERGAPLSRNRRCLLIPATLAFCFLIPSPALPQEEKAKQRPANFENVSGATCIVREESKAGTMPAFHVYLSLDYVDGHSWSTREAIVPVNYEPTNTVKERWQRRAKARTKAYKYCDEWDLEVALQLDKIHRQKEQKENAAPVQRASKD